MDRLANFSFIKLAVIYSFILLLTACAGESSAPGGILPGNNVPQANAGPDQNNIVTGAVVDLDGSASDDADDDSLTFDWSFINVPTDSNATLDNSTLERPSFTADRDGSYTLRLIVNDGQANSSADNIVITATAANRAPVADAGTDKGVTTGSLVMLNGSGSSDADGDPRTYVWEIISSPTNSTATLSNSLIVNPEFTADLDGSYTVRLIVNDGQVNSQPDDIVITASSTNSAPIANAGADKNVSTGDLVMLNGSGSSDADSGDPRNYVWEIISTPTNSTATLSDSNIVNPSFTADLDGSYTVRLVVNDGQVNSQPDDIVITASPMNSVPVADAGTDQNVPTGSVVILDGRGSDGANGDSLNFDWSFVNVPMNSGAALDDPTLERPRFTADMDGTYTLSLVVNDGEFDSTADTVIITSTTSNSIPVADAGPDQTNISTGSLVTLDGSASDDADMDSLTFDWSFVSVPDTSNAASTLNNNTLESPTFTPDLDGSYELSLTVNDGQVDSVANSVVITSNSQSSRFDDFAGDGPLSGDYIINNQGDLPQVERVNNRYRANLVDNAGDKTLHFNNFQGRLDAKLATFPFEAIARNIGIGTQGDSQTAPSSGSSPIIFAGLQVHVTTLSERNSSHVVVGHRAGTGFTIEGKNTRNGSSSVTDEGTNAAPDGRADLRIVGGADRRLTVYWQQPNLTGDSGNDSWQPYKGSGSLPGTAPTYDATVYVGLITYAQGSTGVPFVGTCDSFEIID